MPATLMQLRRLVRSRLGIPISDDFMPDHVIDDHVNLAIQAVESENRWPWQDVVEQVTVTAEAPDIVLDPSWRATRAVFCGQVELYLVAPGDLLSYEGATADYPRVWCPLGEVVAVRPIVNASTQLVHYWYAQPVWLREDSDVSHIPDQYAGAIVAKASELLAARESSGGDATRHKDEYTAMVTKMRRDTRRSTSPARPRVRPGGWI
jgi:hypothetical protein